MAEASQCGNTSTKFSSTILDLPESGAATCTLVLSEAGIRVGIRGAQT